MNRKTVCNGLIFCLVVEMGCVTQKTVTSAYVVPKMHRVAVMPFQRDKNAAAEHEFAKSLVAGGLDVMNQPKTADAVLSGTVIDYRSDRQILVFLGSTSSIGSNGQLMSVVDPVVTPSGSTLTPGGIALKSPHVIAVHASVGVAARLTDPKTGRVLWAGEYAYEGLDLASALQAVTNVLSQSLQRALLQMTPTK